MAAWHHLAQHDVKTISLDSSSTNCEFYLPFAHSEDLADQDRAVVLCDHLGQPDSVNSRRHRDIVKRFGRFPHRNVILGRRMTPEQQAFLDPGGYAG